MIAQCFGAQWQSKITNHQYKEQNDQGSSLSLTICSQILQKNMRQKYDAQIIKNEDAIKQIRFVGVNRNLQKFNVVLYFYNFNQMNMHIQDKQLQFSYNVNAIYTTPLYEKAYMNFQKRCFNIIEYFNFQSRSLLIQLSKYQSDVVNSKQGINRLNTKDQRPAINKMEEYSICPKINFFEFIHKLINFLPVQNLSFFQGLSNWGSEGKYSSDIYNLMKNPFHFIPLKTNNNKKIKMSQFFQKKCKSIVRVNDGTDLQLQQIIAIQPLKQKVIPFECKSVIYLYNSKETDDLFFKQMLLFSYKSVGIIKTPLSQKQFTNLIFKRNYLLLKCASFYLTIEIHQTNTICIQISKQQSDVVKMIKNVNRTDSSYWTSIQEQQYLCPQGKTQSLIYIINLIVQAISKNQGEINWKKSNKIIGELFQIFKG